MIKINPLFPVYIENNTLRIGNLPITGKYIENVDPIIIEIVRDVIEQPRTREYLLNKLISSDISNADSKQIIDDLVSTEIFFEKEKINSFDRQELFFSMFDLQKAPQFVKLLSSSRIMVIGVGAIGCSVSNILCRSGINNFILVDNDIVEESNLRRQSLFFIDDIGHSKISSAKKRLMKIRNDLNIQEVNIDILKLSSLKKYNPDIVICTADSPARLIREHVNKICVREEIPLIFAGFSEYMGIVGPLILPGTSPCWECIQEQLGELPEDINSDRVTPSFGGLCEVVGAFTATEVIKYLTNFSNIEIIGKELMINLITLENEITSWKQIPNCKICQRRNMK